jgi:creatinine amidohydrolase
MLHVEPLGVLMQRAVAGNTASLDRLLPRLRAEGVREVSPSGVLGDPAGASPEEGAALFDELVARLVAGAVTWRVDPTGRLNE